MVLNLVSGLLFCLNRHTWQLSHPEFFSIPVIWSPRGEAASEARALANFYVQPYRSRQRPVNWKKPNLTEQQALRPSP
jgi:hypothetical protein